MAISIEDPIGIQQWDHHEYQRLDASSLDGDFVSSDSCLVAAGPPLLSQTGGVILNVSVGDGALDTNVQNTAAYPIGLAQGVNIGQNLQQMRLYEVGSNFDYIVTGRSVGQVTFTRAFYSATNLLRVLYAYYSTSTEVALDSLFNPAALAGGALNDVHIPPGSNNIYMNLFSDLFKNPIGLLFIMRTAQNQDVGAFYLERCVVHAHNIAFDAQGVVVQENATLSFSRIESVSVSLATLAGQISQAFQGITGLRF